MSLGVWEGISLTSAGSMMHMSGEGAETLAVVTHGHGSDVNCGR